MIGFYSNRSGRYEAWTLRPDGSNLELLARAEAGSLWYPEWSPDGRQIAVAGSSTSRLVDPGKPFGERIVLELPRLPDGTVFHAVSWSADARHLAGMGLRPDGSSGGVWLYMSTRGGTSVSPPSGRIPQLLADGRGLVYYDQGSVLRFLDIRSGRSVRTAVHGLVRQDQQPAVQGLARQPADRVPALRERGRHLADEPGVRRATYAISRIRVATAAACSSTIGRPMPAT